MNDLIAVRVDALEVERIVNTLVEELCAMDGPEKLERLRVAFSDEFTLNPRRFVASQTRQYYAVKNHGRIEAIIGTRSTSDLSANLSSIARILPKDSRSGSGADYIEVVIETVLFPTGIKRIVARATTPGGVKAFEELKRRREGRNYWVETIPARPIGITAMVIRD